MSDRDLRPDWDGLAGSQLVSFLGGAPNVGVTTFDQNTGADSGSVAESAAHLDSVDHNGKAETPPTTILASA